MMSTIRMNSMPPSVPHGGAPDGRSAGTGPAAVRAPGPPRGLHAEVPPRRPRRHPTPRGAGDEAGAHEVRLADLLDGRNLFTDGERERPDAHGPSAVPGDERGEHRPVEPVEAAAVDVEDDERRAGDVEGDAAVGVDVRVVPHPPEQPVGNAGVPRDREATSAAASRVMSTPRIPAARTTTSVRSSVS